MKKQQLQLELKNVPTDASQVCSSTNQKLNKEETLSVSGIVLDCNNPEVNLSQQTERLKAVVFVQNIEGKPLMPCTPAKAKKLLKKKRARVVKLYPFTIKLNFECENQVQDVELGIDSGFNNIGFSAVSAKKELTAGILILDDKTSKRLADRKMYRNNRRNKLWHRKPRWKNRKRKEGWLPPSVQRRYDTHLSLIKRLKDVLPISKITIEIAKFDIQKIENPDISGSAYQEGDMLGYQNVRGYLMTREHGKCQLCGKEFTKGNPSHIHHCKERGKQGSNRVSNLVIIHKKCHEKLHKKGLKLSAPKQYKASTFMSIVNKRFELDIPDLNITYGYITFTERIKQGIEKTHYNDAFVIAGGNSQERCLPIEIKQKHRNNRILQRNRKGFKPSIRKQRYSIQPKDLVWIAGKKYVSKGTHDKGRYVILENFKKNQPTKNIEKIYHFGSFCYE